MSFGFRPKRSAHDALQVLIDEALGGRRWVVETDIASCFEAIPHDRLMQTIEERICDRQILKLLRFLAAESWRTEWCTVPSPAHPKVGWFPLTLQRLPEPA